MHVSFNKAMENMNKSLLIIPLFSAVFFCTSVFEETSFKIKGQIHLPNFLYINNPTV